MISLRKHFEILTRSPRDGQAVVPTAVEAPVNPEERRDETTVAEFCRVLTAVGESGKRAVPALGDELVRNFKQIEDAFTRLSQPASIETTSSRMRAELSRWADRAYQHHSDNEREIREIIEVVARATESVAERDKKYATQIGDMSGRLGAIADMNDLATIRRSIIEGTRALKACVEKMAEESAESLSRLTNQVAEYRTRLEESERALVTDELTQLANRRAFENELDVRISGGHTFNLIMIDLNGFKSVNDRHGHLAGDDLLKQFAGELSLQFMPEDILARWGGDEFAALVYGEQSIAELRVERIRRWALGEYKLTVNGEVVKVRLDAAIGCVAWDGEEKGPELVARADKCCYADKDQGRSRR
jgi:diguanylate cyclase (GGDEF)-like protein